jgi:hypothetical protein
MAVSLDFKIDASQLKRAEAFCLAISNKLDRVTAVAMTRSAKAAQLELKAQTPRYINNPTRWTLNSTFVKPATEQKLITTVGFKDYSSSGTPAAKYLNPQVVGGRRGPKGFENRLASRGLGQFLAPSGNAPLKLDRYGNVPGSKVVQVLSRLGAMREAGSMSNRTGSPRSSAKRREADYFVAEINGTRAIWARKGKRGIVPVFFFLRAAPTYTPRFPVPRILTDAFDNAFRVEFERAVEQELAYQLRKGGR